MYWLLKYWSFIVIDPVIITHFLLRVSVSFFSKMYLFIRYNYFFFFNFFFFYFFSLVSKRYSFGRLSLFKSCFISIIIIKDFFIIKLLLLLLSLKINSKKLSKKFKKLFLIYISYFLLQIWNTLDIYIRNCPTDWFSIKCTFFLSLYFFYSDFLEYYCLLKISETSKGSVIFFIRDLQISRIRRSSEKCCDRYLRLFSLRASRLIVCITRACDMLYANDEGSTCLFAP